MPPHAARTDAGPHPDFCVLASCSRGNCAVLRVPDGDGDARLVLIDAGITPRRTGEILAGMGLRIDQIDAAVFTHFDTDHYHPRWLQDLPPHTRVCVHRAHRRRAESVGLLHRRTTIYDDDVQITLGKGDTPAPGPTLRLRPALVAHDDVGAVAFRFELPGAASLGYATDLGAADADLIRLLDRVGVLAIESNYCPEMQRLSARPAFLKRRITGGAGHLSNHQSADAARRIAPRHTLVLLHLSAECNTPALAAAAHTPPPAPMVIASQDAPTRWIATPPDPTPPLPPPVVVAQPCLFASSPG